MNLKNKIYTFILYSLACGILLFSYSCKSTKELGQISMSEKSKIELLDLINNNSLQYNTLSSSLKFSVKPGQKSKNTSADAQLRIIKDKAIQLSLRMPILNSELFRVLVTPDSLVLIDRMNKLYLAESMNSLKAKASFDFDFYNLQALFTNQLFIAGKPQITSNDYASLNVEQFQYKALVRNQDKQQIQYTFTSDYTNRIQSTEMAAKNNITRMLWMYEEFGSTSDAQIFPMKMKMDLNLPKDIVNMNFSFSKIEINNEFQIDFSLPTKYQQITLEQALKIINDL